MIDRVKERSVGDMNASPRSAHRVTRTISLPVRLAAAGFAVAAASTAFAPSASAGEFYANPTLSPLNECKDGEYIYSLGLYNFAPSNDSTTFTVTVSGVAEGDSSTQHTVAPGGVEWLTFTVPEAVTGSFHVVNSDPDHPIDFLAEPRADCVADPEGLVSVVCDADGPTDANIVYAWRNTSYASAHFGLSQASAVFFEDDYVWQDHEQLVEVPVVEGEHVAASIIVDGVTLSAIDTTVDCLPDPTIPDTVPETIPDTVPATIPDTIPETVPETVPATTIDVLVTMPTTEIPTTTPVITMADPASSVAQLPRPEGLELPVTGSSQSSGSAKIALGLLAAGLGLVRYARRTR